MFLVFLKPIISGTGFSFKELETSEEKRLDIVVLFLDEKFIIDLKLLPGPEYRKQVIDRLKNNMFHENAGTGYMLIMDKSRHKEFTNSEDEGILIVLI